MNMCMFFIPFSDVIVAYNHPYSCLEPCIQLPNPHERKYYQDLNLAYM